MRASSVLHDAPEPRHIAPIEAASQDDARWFSQNPRRSHRIRPPVPGEFPASVRRGLTRWVVVRRMAPGIRCRLSFASTGTPPFTEEGAIRIFQRLMQIGAGTFKTEGCGNA